MLIKELEEKVEKFQTDLDESRKELSSYKNMVKEKDSRIDSLTNELDTVTNIFITNSSHVYIELVFACHF